MTNLTKAHRWSKKLGKCPGVAAIFLSGSLAQGRSNKHSDIDFFVITKPGQIWTARFFIFVTLKFHKQLAKPNHHQGTICPNHFITYDNLEITEKDAYSANLFSHNQPLYDPLSIFPNFITANQWVTDFDESFPSSLTTNSQLPTTQLNLLQKIAEYILKPVQIYITKKNPEYKTPGAKIILSDTELRFHPKPRNKDWSK